ncbi:MAG: hypothetical protein IJM82_00855 [Synergistaceae bacterium]|nr:hypothetical protein [Synergistaceae bacterium]MBQ6737089.1 hypothetical protein [Synergistaceae bacterium]MBQ7067695.1 hypothetical protein [Synergistaceae bacterium]MBR0075805.1 hypothetical protein [Synergistaceae bacterium]MBR0079753.1 hypothetical protein [Synergistaceae bacterium]
MSIQNINSSIQNNSEQYQIRKQTETQKVDEIQQPQPSQEVQTQNIDEYDKSNPVGEEVEGIYSVSSDDEGNLKVNYKQPEAKTSQPVNVQQNSSSDDSDDEIEKLKEQRDSIRQQLNRETDETVKSQLRAEIQSLEVQIALKSAN